MKQTTQDVLDAAGRTERAIHRELLHADAPAVSAWLLERFDGIMADAPRIAVGPDPHQVASAAVWLSGMGNIPRSMIEVFEDHRDACSCRDGYVGVLHYGDNNHDLYPAAVYQVSWVGEPFAAAAGELGIQQRPLHGEPAQAESAAGAHWQINLVLSADLLELLYGGPRT